MRALKFYGEPVPGVQDQEVPGRLIVLEGPDRVGRSTQIRLLKEWLEDNGFGVVDTGLTRSELAGPGIQRAKSGHTLDPVTLNLFYATDFCDRLERLILPSLRAGMVVLADRYIFSIIARAGVRGVPVGWLEAVLGFAPIPDRIIYMDADVEHLLPRTLMRGAFDYWESGQDFLAIDDPHDSYLEYQRLLRDQFKSLAERHGFVEVDANQPLGETFKAVLSEVRAVTDNMGSGDSEDGLRE